MCVLRGNLRENKNRAFREETNVYGNHGPIKSTCGNPGPMICTCGNWTD